MSPGGAVFKRHLTAFTDHAKVELKWPEFDVVAHCTLEKVVPRLLLPLQEEGRSIAMPPARGLLGQQHGYGYGDGIFNDMRTLCQKFCPEYLEEEMRELKGTNGEQSELDNVRNDEKKGEDEDEEEEEDLD